MSERLVILQATAPWFIQIEGMLAQAGWRVLGMPEFEALPRVAQQQVRAGVARLNEGNEAELDELDALIAGRPDIEWLALVSADCLSNAKLCRFLRNRFFDFHTLPIDRERLLASLGHAEGKARLASMGADSEIAGRHGMIGPIALQSAKKTSNIVDFLEDSLKDIEEMRYKVCDNDESALQNIIDEIVGLYLSTLYKLKFLA